MKKEMCLSCGGVSVKDQPGGYYHQCHPETENPRNENRDEAGNIKPGKGVKVIRLVEV